MTENTDTDRLRALRRVVDRPCKSAQTVNRVYRDDETGIVYVNVGRSMPCWGYTLDAALDAVIEHQRKEGQKDGHV